MIKLLEIKAVVNQALAYLGKRFDNIELRMSDSKDSKVADAFENAAKQLERVAMQVMANSGSGEKQTESKKDSKADESARESVMILKTVASNLSDCAEAMNQSGLGSHFENVVGELKVSMDQIVSSIKDMKLETPEIAIEGLETLEVLVESISKRMNEISLRETNSLLASIVTILKKDPKYPKSFKLDDGQFRELRTVLGGGGKSSGGVTVVGGGSSGGGSVPVSGIRDGRQVVAVTNTPVALNATSLKIQTVFITAIVGNLNVIVVGGPTVTYTEASRTGKIIYPGDSITITIDDLSKVYINGAAGEGVTFTYLK